VTGVPDVCSSDLYSIHVQRYPIYCFRPNLKLMTTISINTH